MTPTLLATVYNQPSLGKGSEDSHRFGTFIQGGGTFGDKTEKTGGSKSL